MKNMMLKTVSVFGLTAAMAMPAAAMTCGEFDALSADEKMAAMYDMGGREAARQASRGNDPDMGGDDQVIVENNDDTEGGREGARERMKGADVMVKIREMCEGNPDMDMDDVMSSKER
ncbi:hypothetical protein [Roseovarius sp. E0-M6]|uniref:hypothetical protein n=1 Tax=Roseovarius sp. E0-M6 TaxID=3127118 RepID=UPI00300F91BA